jgi:hypothetical protein
MRYQVLPRDRWNELSQIYKDMGGIPPISDLYAQLAVAIEDEKIVGNSSLQSVLCIEATRVDPDYSGKVGFRNLHKCLLATQPKGNHYFAFAINEKMEKICEYVGLERLDWKVFRGIS